MTEGSIVNDRSYTGIILRQETTKYAESSGYVNYYIRECKKASVGTNVYSIDATGTLAQILEESTLNHDRLPLQLPGKYHHCNQQHRNAKNKADR